MFISRFISLVAVASTVLFTGTNGQNTITVTPIASDPTALLGLGVCAQATVSVLGIQALNNLCLCVTGDTLTAGSVVKITDVLSAQGLLGGLVNGLGVIANSVLQTLSIAPVLQAGPAGVSCNLPANSVSNSCTDCSYSCIDGYLPCGSQCYNTATQQCSSGVPIPKRRRDIRSIPVADRCPGQKTACLLPSSKTFSGTNYECIDTVNNIESCEGCEFPLPGEPQGQDCTAIANVNSVACRNNKCVVDSCQRGFAVNGTECVRSIFVSSPASLGTSSFVTQARADKRRERRSNSARFKNFVV